MSIVRDSSALVLVEQESMGKDGRDALGVEHFRYLHVPVRSGAVTKLKQFILKAGRAGLKAGSKADLLLTDGNGPFSHTHVVPPTGLSITQRTACVKKSGPNMGERGSDDDYSGTVVTRSVHKLNGALRGSESPVTDNDEQFQHRGAIRVKKWSSTSAADRQSALSSGKSVEGQCCDATRQRVRCLKQMMKNGIANERDEFSRSSSAELEERLPMDKPNRLAAPCSGNETLAERASTPSTHKVQYADVIKPGGTEREFYPSRQTRESDNVALRCNDISQANNAELLAEMASPTLATTTGKTMIGEPREVLRGEYIALEWSGRGRRMSSGLALHDQRDDVDEESSGEKHVCCGLRQSKHYQNLIRPVNAVHEQAWLASSPASPTQAWLASSAASPTQAWHASSESWPAQASSGFRKAQPAIGFSQDATATPDIENKAFTTMEDSRSKCFSLQIARSSSSESCYSARSSDYEEMVDCSEQGYRVHVPQKTSQNVQYRKRRIVRQRPDVEKGTSREDVEIASNQTQHVNGKTQHINSATSLRQCSALSNSRSPTPVHRNKQLDCDSRFGSTSPLQHGLLMPSFKSRSSDCILQMAADEESSQHLSPDEESSRRRSSDPASNQKRYGLLLPEHLDFSTGDLHASSTSSSEKETMVTSVTSPTLSSADKVFGTFSVEYVGPSTVSQGYGAIDSAVKQVLHRAKKRIMESTQPCHMTVTASVIKVTTPEGLPVLHHEVDSVECWSPCKVGNARDTSCLLAYVVVQEGITAVCHVFRAQDEKTRNSILSGIQLALYADIKAHKSLTYPHHGLPKSPQHFSVKYVGCVVVQTTYRIIDVAVRRLLTATNPARVGFVVMDINMERIRLSNSSHSNNGIFAAHPPSAIAALSTFSEDSRVFAYVIRQRNATPKCHVFRCSRPATALAVITCIKDVCQESYVNNLKADVQDLAKGQEAVSSRLRQFLARRLPSLSNSEGRSSVSENTDRSSGQDFGFVFSSGEYVFQQIQQVQPAENNGGHASSGDTSGDEKETLYLVDYIGTATVANAKWSCDKVLQATDMFEKYGEDAGLVYGGCSQVKLCLSSKRITLRDPHNNMFVTRNYPRDTLVGVACHPVKRNTFAFCSVPSVTGSSINEPPFRCHVFRSQQSDAVVRKILNLYWPQLNYESVS